MRRHLVAVLLLLFSVSSHTAGAQDAVIEVNPVKAKSYDINKLSTDIKYLRLKVPEDQYFAGIVKIMIKDNIFLLDKSNSGVCKVYCFDLQGNYRYVLDKQGIGPGEYEHIQDFSLTEKNLIISVTSKGLMFYDISDGSYIKTEKIPEEASAQLFSIPDDNIVVLPAGRYMRNRSKKQLKIYDIAAGKMVFEDISFKNPALKLGHSQRPVFYYNDQLSYLPMYGQTVYRINRSGNNYSIKKAYSFDFGKYWIPEDILKESYNDREMFFGSEPQKYVNTVDVFETSQAIYLSYQYKNKQQSCIYDKKSKKTINISEFTNNEVGWIGKPVTTYEDYIVNVVSPIDITTAGIDPSPDLKKVIAETDEEGRPILVFARFSIQ